MKLTRHQLQKIIQESFLQDIFGKKVKSLSDVTTVGDFKKLIKYAQSKKRSELGKEAAKEWAKSSLWDETIGAIPGMATAKNAGDVIKAMYNLPDTARTGTALDHMDIDDDVAKIVDDPIENAFLEALLDEIEGMSDDAPMDNLNVTKGLANYLEKKFNARTVAGFSESKQKGNIMRITKRQLKRIIKEEKARLLKESQDVHRFEEIMQEMYELNEEALQIVSESGTASRERAYRYWYAHIQGAIGQDSDFLGGSMISMSDTLEELNGPDEEQMAEEGYKDGASGKEPVYPDNEVYMINYEDGYEDSIPD